MDQETLGNPFTAVLLAAGYGSRIASLTTKPKCLLEIKGETLLERNFRIWKKLGIKNISLVLGYEADLLKSIAKKYESDFNISYRLNADFRNLGNTYSLLKGIENLDHATLIFDADLAYSEDILREFLKTGETDEILVGKGSISDIECAKTLTDKEGFVRMTVDKRALTSEELSTFNFAGEAIGILKFSNQTTKSLAEEAKTFLSQQENQNLNWEHLLNQFLPKAQVKSHPFDSAFWMEIDTEEDYLEAQAIFKEDK